MGFDLPSWYFLPLLALIPFLFKKTKEKIAAAPVTTISLARYRLLAAIIQQRKVATGPVKVPILLFVAAALAIVAASQPIPGIPAPGHGVAVVVGVEASNTMNFPGGGSLGGAPRLQLARDKARDIFAALGPGDPSSLVVHDSTVAFSTPLGLSPSVALQTLDSLATGLGGNKPSSAIAQAARLLSSAPPASRRVVVLFNDGGGLGEDIVQALAPIRDLPPDKGGLAGVEGTFVFVSTDPADRAKLDGLANSIGWSVVDINAWSPAQVASGPPTVPGESLLPLAPLLALGAFALVALTVLREVRK